MARFLGFQDSWNNPEDEFANDDHTKRSRWVQKSQTCGQLLKNELKDCTTKMLENVMQVVQGKIIEERAEGFPDD